MLPQTDRFALHFEIPAVLYRFFVQLAIRGDIAGAVFVAATCDLLARRLQLIEKALETTADPRERRRALFLQLAQQPVVLPSRFVDAHAPIFRETSSPDKCGASGAHSSGRCVFHHSRACS